MTSQCKCVQIALMTRDAAISVRVEPALKKELEELAKDDRRTLASYVEGILAAHVEAQRKKAKR